MNLKRILTSLIGFPLVVLLVVLGTTPIINFVIMLIAMICMNEYFNVIKKICNPIKWVGYLSTIIIFLVSFISKEMIYKFILYSNSIILLVLFSHIILTDMKYTFKDVSYTFLGICYVTGFMMFLGLITKSQNGKFWLGYNLVAVAWATDVFAYWAGKTIGKHKFSKVSPKKTIEGCISGALASMTIGIIYVAILNNFEIINAEKISYFYVAVTTLMLSIISQIGDFTASSIKRFADSKDYGSILPGHGGMLDRIDSVIFVAPFIYMIINTIVL